MAHQSYWPINDEFALKANNSLCIVDWRKMQFLKPDFTEEQARAMCIILRYGNPVCDTCWATPPDKKLRRCGNCYVAAYCSKECQRKAWPTHKKRCCKPDGPQETGPQQLAIGKRNQAESDAVTAEL